MEIRANFGLVVKFRLQELKEMYEGGKQMSSFLKPGATNLLMKIDGESGDSLEFRLHEDDMKIGKEVGEYKLLDADAPCIVYRDQFDVLETKEKENNNGVHSGERTECMAGSSEEGVSAQSGN